MSGTVLVTGSAGRLGQAAVRELADRGWFVRGFDLHPTRGADESIVGDLADRAAVSRAMAGVRALVHLAAWPDDDEDFVGRLVPPNIVGVYNVLEAARRERVPRVVLASSGQVVWRQRFTGPLPIQPSDPPTPRGWYACAKVFAESAGQVYAYDNDADVIVARLGWCPRSPEHAAELELTTWAHDVYLSPGDAGRFFGAALDGPGPIGFRIAFVTSAPQREKYVDLSTALELGYRPQDRYPEGLDLA
ncbi:MAG: NAD(P)-dependent oxidoreductase [Planctomyces sp.]|nr:NAD(P)-dependent oxidoreductase [Planctomyces sp.]